MKITLPDGSVKEYKNSDTEALDILRHSTAHLMARAVMRLYDGVQLAFGPTVDNGFYYDFAMEHRLTEEDFPKIEDEMKKLDKITFVVSAY
jgi:threonyl-tRNA synthetase